MSPTPAVVVPLEEAAPGRSRRLRIPGLRALLLAFRSVLRADLALFTRFPRLKLALLGAMAVPALYAGIYLSSAWDPYGHLSELPVAWVDLDVGGSAAGREVNLGHELTARLRDRFQLQPTASAETARERVRRGEVAFAVIVPADLSSRALAGEGDARGRLEVITSEGNGFMAASIGKRLASDAALQLDRALAEARWSAVLENVGRSGVQLAQLRDGVGRLEAGSTQLAEGAARAASGASRLNEGLGRAHAGGVRLADGSSQLTAGTVQLADGMQALGQGIRTLDAKLPAPTDLARLAGGAHALAEGQAQLADGLGKLVEGNGRVEAGAGQLKEGVAGIPLVGGRIAEGAGRLQDGVQQVGAGLQKAESGGAKLAAGAQQLDEGVARLTEGMGRAGEGVHLMASKLPDDAKLDQLRGGATQLRDGAQQLGSGLGALHRGAGQLDTGLVQLAQGSGRLHDGLAELQSKLPTAPPHLDGDAKGLAQSVDGQVEVLAPTGSYGAAMVPYFTGLSLWVGVVMSTFLFQLRWFPKGVARRSRLGRLAGRFVVPALLVSGQALALTLMLRFGIGVSIPSSAAFLLVAVVTSLTFLAIVLALLGLLGDVGKGVALLFLMLQMASSGGIFPIELSGGLFARLHPWLPFTWVVRTLRALLFGAYGGDVVAPLLHVAGFGLLAFAVAALFGRWRWVEPKQLAPALDVGA